MQHLRQLEATTARRQALGMRLLVWGELLHVLRPLIYTLSLRKYCPESALLVQPWRVGSLGPDLCGCSLARVC